MSNSVVAVSRHPRNPPPWQRFAYRMMKKPFFGRFEKPWRWPSGAAEGAYERAEVPGQSGTMLKVLVRRAEGVPKGVLVLAHPMGTAAKGFFIKWGHADAFTRAGYHCVLFDFNGFGESESTSFDYPDDLTAVARWTARQFPDLPLAAVGASFGAMRSLEAAAAPDCPFNVIVAESAAPSLEEFWKVYPAPYAILRVIKLFAPAGERRLRPEALLPTYPPGRRVLLIHSQADVYTPPSHGDALMAAAPPHVTIERLVLDRSEHTHAFRDERERYLASVLPFLERHLARNA
jgi:uncharacterized protein